MFDYIFICLSQYVSSDSTNLGSQYLNQSNPWKQEIYASEFTPT